MNCEFALWTGVALQYVVQSSIDFRQKCFFFSIARVICICCSTQRIKYVGRSSFILTDLCAMYCARDEQNSFVDCIYYRDKVGWYVCETKTFCMNGKVWAFMQNKSTCYSLIITLSPRNIYIHPKLQLKHLNMHIINNIRHHISYHSSSHFHQKF